MLNKTADLLSSLFAHRLTRQVRELYVSSIILNFAVSMISIFEPVFLFVLFRRHLELKGSLEMVLLFYLAVYVFYFFAVPLGARFAKRYGYENSIAVASLFQIGFYFSLFASGRFLWTLSLAVPLYVLAKMFYWPAYHSNFAKFSEEEEQGREISNLWAMESFVYIVAPLLGGAIIEFAGFKVLFVIASILILVSNVPMLATKEQFEPHPFPYRDAFKRVFAKENRLRFWANFGYGEELIVLVIWPIFMFLTITDFLNLGLISAISTLIATIILLFIGRWTDKSDRQSLFVFGTVSYIFSWLVRILARNPLGVLIVDAYSRISKNALSVPFMACIYNNAHNGSVMSTVVFFEMSLVIGKLVAIILCLILLQFFAPGWNAMFILGALFTALYLLFKAK